MFSILWTEGYFNPSVSYPMFKNMRFRNIECESSTLKSSHYSMGCVQKEENMKDRDKCKYKWLGELSVGALSGLNAPFLMRKEFRDEISHLQTRLAQAVKRRSNAKAGFFSKQRRT